jgi:hypothetical protein
MTVMSVFYTSIHHDQSYSLNEEWCETGLYFLQVCCSVCPVEHAPEVWPASLRTVCAFMKTHTNLLLFTFMVAVDFHPVIL